MIDEKKIIQRLQCRIDSFAKDHPEQKNCLQIQVVQEFIHMLQLEAKEQAKRKESV